MLILMYLIYAFYIYLSKNSKLDKIEFLIYHRDFKDFLTEDYFIQFIRLGEKKTITSSKEILAIQGSEFHYLYYFAIIPKLAAAD